MWHNALYHHHTIKPPERSYICYLSILIHGLLDPEMSIQVFETNHFSLFIFILEISNNALILITPTRFIRISGRASISWIRRYKASLNITKGITACDSKNVLIYIVIKTEYDWSNLKSICFKFSIFFKCILGSYNFVTLNYTNPFK